jgi:hypothetical protein
MTTNNFQRKVYLDECANIYANSSSLTTDSVSIKYAYIKGELST